MLQAAEAVDERVVVAVVPGSWVTLTSVELPPRLSRRQALRATPFTLEDHLADDVEALHFAVGPVEADGRRPVAVITRERMGLVVEGLESVGLRASAVVPEPLALPVNDLGWTVLLDGGWAVVRRGAFGGFALETELLGLMFEADGEQALGTGEAGEPAPTVVYACPGAEALPPMPRPAEHRDCESPVMVFRTGVGEPALNLLQGEYSPQEKLRGHWRVWRGAAILAVLALALQFGVRSAEYAALRGEVDGLLTQQAELYRASFPDAQRVVNPRVQMENRLRGLGQGDVGTDQSFLRLVKVAGLAIAGREGVEINGLSYRGNRLDLELRVTNIQTLDGVKRAIEADGGTQAEILSASSEGDRVEGRLRVSRSEQT